MIPPALDFSPESFQLTTNQKLNRRNLELSLDRIPPEEKDKMLMDLFDAYCLKENICKELTKKLLHYDSSSGTFFNK
jgi:SMC interacting uncharacterized protein involved in chromosome segregation